MADLKTPKSVNWHGLNDNGWRMTEKGATESYLSGTREETVTYRGEPGAGDTQRGLTRGEKFSAVLSWFFIIVLLGSLIFVPSFLTDLEVFLPTEEKIIDENGVVHYEVTSNWETDEVVNIGRKSMQVFSTFGSFIRGFGDTLSTVFGIIGNLIPTIEYKDIDEKPVVVPLSPSDYFSSEESFFEFVYIMERQDLASPLYVPVYLTERNVYYRVVPLSIYEYYREHYSEYSTFFTRFYGWAYHLYYDWNNYGSLVLYSDLGGTT